MVLCPKCGKENPDTISICIYCGDKLPKEEKIKKPKMGKKRRIVVCFLILLVIATVILIKYQIAPPAKEERLLSMDFENADIQNVLRMLSSKSGLNIITDPELTGKVNISLRDVTVEDALNTILEEHGFTFEREGKIIRVLRHSYTTEELSELGKEEKIKSNIAIVTKIAEDYHKSHTYSFHDLFVCGDMAIDVWNQIKTKGINATISVGNVEKLDASIEDINHAWVLAEVEPFEWLAVETTSGRVIYASENPAYYQGSNFNTPAEFKIYLELTKEYNRLVKVLDKLSINDPSYHKEFIKLNDIINQIIGLLY